MGVVAVFVAFKATLVVGKVLEVVGAALVVGVAVVVGPLLVLVGAYLDGHWL